MSTTEHLLDDTRLESVLVVVAEVANAAVGPQKARCGASHRLRKRHHGKNSEYGSRAK